MNWMKGAVCAHPMIDTEIFFPTGKSRAESARARALCRVCPVQLDCLEQALSRQEMGGIWGGLDPDQRRRLLRERRQRG